MLAGSLIFVSMFIENLKITNDFMFLFMLKDKDQKPYSSAFLLRGKLLFADWSLLSFQMTFKEFVAFHTSSVTSNGVWSQLQSCVTSDCVITAQRNALLLTPNSQT